MEKDSLLLNFSFVTYMGRKEHTTLDGKYMDFGDKIIEQMRKVADEFELQFDCHSASLRVLVGDGIEPDNSGRCIVCNKWVSAQNKDNIFTELGVGAEYKNELYCQQHLPKESPMYSKLFPMWEREEE